MKPIPEIYQDEIDAMQTEKIFALNLDDDSAPFRAETQPHVGEGGATTAYYQNAALVGVSTRIRDDLNRTILLCVNLR